MKQVKRVKEWKGARVYRLTVDYEGPQDWWGYGGGELWEEYFKKSFYPVDPDRLYLPFSYFVEFLRKAAKIKGYREEGPTYAPHPFLIDWVGWDSPEVKELKEEMRRLYEAEEDTFDAYAKELYERGGK